MNNENKHLELLEFKNKALELCNVKETKDIGNVLMETVLNHTEDFYNKYLEIVDDTKDWLQALWQYYEADRTDKKQDYTPKSLCNLVSALAGNCNCFYDCCGGSGALSIDMLKKYEQIQNVYVEELDENVIPFLLFNLCLHNASGFVVNGNVLTQRKIKAYRLFSGTKYSKVIEIHDLNMFKDVENIPLDVSISNPPYNIKWQPPTPLEMDSRFPVIPPASNANYAFVLHCLHRATNKAILILPNGIASQRTESEVRKYLIDNDLIETVISLPNNMFECTSIATCIMVLNKKKKNKGKVTLIHSVENCETEEREQNGQFGGKSHTNRTYKKKYNVLSDENVQKILDVIENQQEIKQFSVIKTNEQIAEKKYMLAPSRYFEVDIEDFTDTQHRDFKQIADNINYISRMQNSCKLVINETIAKQLGFDVDLYKQSNGNSKSMKEQMKPLGIDIEVEDYIQFTKNKNEFVFKCNDKEILPEILLQFLSVWKNQIALLNTMQNQYLAELRNAMLPDLMSGKIDVSSIK